MGFATSYRSGIPARQTVRMLSRRECVLLPGDLTLKEFFMKNVKPGRAQRIGEQIARDLAELIPQEVRDPRVGLVTITGCGDAAQHSL